MIVAAVLLPVVPFVVFRSQVLDRLTDRLKRDVAASAPLLLYTAVWLAAVFGLFGAAAATGVGIPAAIAFGISLLAVVVLITKDEHTDLDGFGL